MSLGTFEVTLQCRDLFFFSNVHAMKSMLLDFCDTFLCFLPCVRYLEQFPLCLRFLALYCALRKIPPSPFSNAPVNNKVSKKFTEIPIFAVRHERKGGRSQHLSYDSRFPPLAHPCPLSSCTGLSLRTSYKQGSKSEWGIKVKLAVQGVGCE